MLILYKTVLETDAEINEGRYLGLYGGGNSDGSGVS